MKVPFGDIGEEAARKHVQEGLEHWKENEEGEKHFTPEDVISFMWSGRQPWLLRVDREALEALKKLAVLQGELDRALAAGIGSNSYDAFTTVATLRAEKQLDDAIDRIRHPEAHGPAGDVLHLCPTLEEEAEVRDLAPEVVPLADRVQLPRRRRTIPNVPGFSTPSGAPLPPAVYN